MSSKKNKEENEARSRADKINSIKNSIRSNSDDEETAAETAAVAEDSETSESDGETDTRETADTAVSQENDPAEVAADTAASQESGVETADAEDSEGSTGKKKKRSFKERFLGLFPQKGDGVAECIRKIIFLISIIAIVVCGYIVSDYYIDLWRSKSITQNLINQYTQYDNDRPTFEESETEERFYVMLDGAKKLLDINPDVAGWIEIPGTPVQNPVMKAPDNFKYLDRKIDGSENRTGELFLDYRNKFDEVKDGRLAVPNSDNLIIYGHAMKDQTMFGSLINYRNVEDYYSQHPVIYLNSNYEKYVYKIFAFFILDAEDKSETKYDCWNKLNFDSEEDFYKFVNEAKKRSIRLNEVDVEYGDSLLTLSTCDTILGDRGRLIVMARRVRKGEYPKTGTKNSTPNPNIKWPTYYYDIRYSERYDPNAEFIPYGPEE